MHHQGANKRPNRGKNPTHIGNTITHCREIDVVRVAVGFYEGNCQLSLVMQLASPATQEAEK